MIARFTPLPSADPIAAQPFIGDRLMQGSVGEGEFVEVLERLDVSLVEISQMDDYTLLIHLAGADVRAFGLFKQGVKEQ